MALTAKQQRFVDEYLIDLNATQAVIRAGYSKNRASEIGYQLLQKTTVEEYLAEAMKARESRTHITQDRVLQELSRIAFFDIRKLYKEDGSLKKPSELDDDAAAVLAGIDVVEMTGGMGIGADGMPQHIPMSTKKAKIFDKNGALTLAMRHLGMLNDKMEHSGNVTLSIADQIKQAHESRKRE